MRSDGEPVVDRPYMPGYGVAAGTAGLLPWSWALRRLETTHNYWLATATADGVPHLAAVWGVWLDNAFYFSTGGRSRKARDLRRNRRCSVCADGADNSVVVNGVAVTVTDEAVVGKVASAYGSKYASGFPPLAENPLFEVRPLTVVAVIEHDPDFTQRATRWTFS
jgi:general stress protein 26